MILVDSSVWINFIGGHGTGSSLRLRPLLVEENKVCTCGMILQEILQGVRNDRDSDLVRQHLEYLPYIEARKSTYILAAEIYRTLRKKGMTIPNGDALIAAVTLENGLSLFTVDLHFKDIGKHYKHIRLY